MRLIRRLRRLAVLGTAGLLSLSLVAFSSVAFMELTPSQATSRLALGLTLATVAVGAVFAVYVLDVRRLTKANRDLATMSEEQSATIKDVRLMLKDVETRIATTAASSANVASIVLDAVSSIHPETGDSVAQRRQPHGG